MWEAPSIPWEMAQVCMRELVQHKPVGETPSCVPPWYLLDFLPQIPIAMDYDEKIQAEMNPFLLKMLLTDICQRTRKQTSNSYYCYDRVSTQTSNLEVKGIIFNSSSRGRVVHHGGKLWEPGCDASLTVR